LLHRMIKFVTPMSDTCQTYDRQAAVPNSAGPSSAKFLAFTVDSIFLTAKFLAVTGILMSEMSQLSRRERQIMEVIYGRGEATATDVLQNLPDAPTRTSIRTFLSILEKKGHLKHKKRNREYVFYPTRLRARAGKSAFQRLLHTFFDGSLEKAVAAYLYDPSAEISAEELKRLSSLINEAKRKQP
jgi:BlaI family transcriptional regulator, penicillinase repressor